MQVAQLTEALTPLKHCTTIAVAVSGGSDSMALVHLMHQWAKEHNKKIIALTVNHQLRPESTQEATQVHQWLAASGIEHHILLWQHKEKPESNIQEQARQARYHLMTEWCKQHNITHLVTAHHLNDQAETFLIRLLRGSGVDGLAAIPQENTYNGVTLFRPLLNTTHKALLDYLAEHNINWLEDPSNQNPRYTRTQIRSFLSSPNALTDDAELLSKRLSDTAAHMQRTRNYLEQQTEEAFRQCVQIDNFGNATVNIPSFATLHEEIGLRLLALLLCNVSGNPLKPRFAKLYYLYEQLQQPETFSGQTLWGCAITPEGKGRVLFTREFSTLPHTSITPDTPLTWDNRFRCTLTNHNKLPQSGLEIRPIGSTSYKKYLENAPQPIKNTKKVLINALPALFHLETLLAAPHISYYKEDWLQQSFTIETL